MDFRIVYYNSLIFKYTMYITLILFLIGIRKVAQGIVLNRKNIILPTSKLLKLDCYSNVDLIGPTFNPLSEGLFFSNFFFSRFMVSDFFAREVGVSRAQFIKIFYAIAAQIIWNAALVFYVRIFKNIKGYSCFALKVLYRWITDRRFKFSRLLRSTKKFLYIFFSYALNIWDRDPCPTGNESLKFYNFGTKRHNANYILRNKVYFSTSRCIQIDNNNLKPAVVYVNGDSVVNKEEVHFTTVFNKSANFKLDARERMLKLNEAKGIKVKVTDLRTNEATVYNSLRLAAKALSTDLKSIYYNENLQKERGTLVPFKTHYLLKIVFIKKNLLRIFFINKKNRKEE